MAILSPRFLILAALIGVFLEWVRRVFWMRGFRRLNPPIRPATERLARAPKVSVIVPARDEERNIGGCLRHLLKQEYPDYEIVVVDDRSVDRTPHLIENFKKLAAVPLKTIRVEKLPPGWTGKNHAMFVGSRAAAGEWLLFTDADTTHSVHSVRSALGTALDQNIDFLTLAPEVECRSFWENTVQPLAVSSLALWFNTPKLNDADSKATLANGQFILVKKSAYEAVGGNESVKDQVVEDVELAKKFKSAGLKVRFLNGTLLYSTRMYSSLAEIIRGWTRILVYLFNKKIPAVLRKIGLFLFFSIFPFAVLSVEKFYWLSGNSSFSLLLFLSSAAVCFWIVLVRFFGNRLLRCNPWYALLHPLGSLVMAWILFVCVGRIATRRPSLWRGDRY